MLASGRTKSGKPGVCAQRASLPVGDEREVIDSTEAKNGSAPVEACPSPVGAQGRESMFHDGQGRLHGGGAPEKSQRQKDGGSKGLRQEEQGVFGKWWKAWAE